MDHASRLPKLVPVFQATLAEDENCCHCNSSSGRETSTIASNAPYVGLLGTVFGIILTFFAIGVNGMTDSGAIMTGLALALKATAFGLLVAIPAIVFHNYLVRKMEVIIMRWEIKNGD